MLNQIKTAVLLGALTGILLLIGSFWGQGGVVAAFIFAMLINFGSYWFSDKIVLKIYRAKEAPVSKYPRLYQIINKVAKKAKVPAPKVYIIPTQTPNAFATGRDPKHAAIAVTEGILQLLSEKELEGVIAHEIAHIKNRDILIATIAATIAGAISFIAMLARWSAIFGGGRRGSRGLELLFLAILAPIIALIIRLAISRSREFLADETGAKTIRESKSLASALRKLELANKVHPLRFGSETTAHMFIVNPFRASLLLKLFSTHPPVDERIKRLNKLKF